MNVERIEARIAKERERQTRANLEAYIRTSAEGREEDRMVINNLMAIGALTCTMLKGLLCLLFGKSTIFFSNSSALFLSSICVGKICSQFT